MKNAIKSSVDQSNQIMSFQPPFRKTKMWHRMLAFEIIMYNAVVSYWILFKEVNKVNIVVPD